MGMTIRVCFRYTRRLTRRERSDEAVSSSPKHSTRRRFQDTSVKTC
jgi:hypothetical protein